MAESIEKDSIFGRPRALMISKYDLLSEATALTEGAQQSEKPRAFNECWITTSIRETQWRNHNSMLAGSYSVSPSLQVGKLPARQQPIDGFDTDSQNDHELLRVSASQIRTRGGCQSTGKLYGRPLQKIHDFWGFTIRMIDGKRCIRWTRQSLLLPTTRERDMPGGCLFENSEARNARFHL
jgi:hypothetical protein